MGRTAVIAGATGLVGGHLLRRLLASEPYTRVIALTRRPLDVDHPKLDQQVVDFDRLHELSLPEVDDVFCCLGTTIRVAGSQEAFRKVDHDYVVELARACSRAGARQFLLVSSIGADPNSKNFYLRVKGETERDLRTIPYAGMFLIRPSLLLGERRERRPGESIAAALAKPLAWLVLRGPLRKYRPVAADRVAEFMLVAALRGASGVRVLESDRIGG